MREELRYLDAEGGVVEPERAVRLERLFFDDEGRLVEKRWYTLAGAPPMGPGDPAPPAPVRSAEELAELARRAAGDAPGYGARRK